MHARVPKNQLLVKQIALPLRQIGNNFTTIAYIMLTTYVQCICIFMHIKYENYITNSHTKKDPFPMFVVYMRCALRNIWLHVLERDFSIHYKFRCIFWFLWFELWVHNNLYGICIMQLYMQCLRLFFFQLTWQTTRFLIHCWLLVILISCVYEQFLNQFALNGIVIFWLIFDVFVVNSVNGGVLDIFVAVLADFEDFDSYEENMDIVVVVLLVQFIRFFETVFIE